MKPLALAAATAMLATLLIAPVKQTGARLWIEHDLATFNLLKTAPAFYE